MEKYNKELINKYINGKDINNCSIEELENDKDFMMQVIRISNDKKIYNLCSERIKQDYEMVKFMVLIFKNDLEFIEEVADKYLDNADDLLERIELALIMLDLTTKKDKEKALKYKILTDTIFSSKRLEVEICKAKENNDDFSADVGMGFWYMFDLYNSSDIVTKFFAEKTIDAIFDEYDINIEQILHSKFKNAEEIKSQGINNYMISFISMYDKMLASYVSTHLELLSGFSDKILCVINNWSNYNVKEERKRYNNMIEQVHEYMEDVNSVMSETDILYFIARKMGIAEKLAYYDGLSNEFFEEMIGDIDLSLIDESDDDFVTFTINNSLEDRRYYNDVKTIMMNTLFGSKTSGELGLQESKNLKKDKCKILKLNFNNKNKD